MGKTTETIGMVTIDDVTISVDKVLDKEDSDKIGENFEFRFYMNDIHDSSPKLIGSLQGCERSRRTFYVSSFSINDQYQGHYYGRACFQVIENHIRQLTRNSDGTSRFKRICGLYANGNEKLAQYYHEQLGFTIHKSNFSFSKEL